MRRRNSGGKVLTLVAVGTALLLMAGPVRAGLYVVPTGNSGSWKIYQVVASSQTWTAAEAAAAASVDPLLGTSTTGHLVAIGSSEENALVKSLIGTSSCWIGATDDSAYGTTEGNWIWSNDGTQFWSGTGSGSAVGGNYANWNSGEPNNSSGENFAEINGNSGGWNDLNSTAARYYVVEYETDVASLPETTGTLILDPASGKYYERDATARTWTDAKAYAESRALQGVQGRLVQVNSMSENQFLRSLGGGWIGLTDNELFGGTESIGSTDKYYDGWVWTGPADSTGTYTVDATLAATGYTNWNSGEPNGTGEDAIEVQSTGRWNDLPHDSGSHLRYGIVEYNLAETVPLNIRVRTVNGTSLGTDVTAIQNLLNGQSTSTGSAEGQYATINLGDPENSSGSGTFAGYAPFPNDTSADDNNFAVKAYATVEIETAGDYTFGIRHDDQAQLVVDRGEDTAAVYTTAAQTGEHFTTVNFASPGTYNLYLAFAEIGGGAQLELYSAPGALTAFDSTFQLVGDTLNGGLATTELRDIYINGGAFTVRDVHSTSSVGNLSQTDDLLDNGSPGISSEATGKYLSVNFLNSGGNGHFGNDAAFPAATSGDDNNFAVEATGMLMVDEASAGWWTFGVNSDDGFRLSIDGADFAYAYGQSGTAIDGDGNLYYGSGRGVDDSLGAIYLAAGSYELNLRYWEGGGGSALELYYAAGVHTSFDSSFDLLTAHVPEPSTVAMLLGLAGAGLVTIVRRRRRR